MLKQENHKQLTKRILAVALLFLGILLGGTWKRTGFCFGDRVFSALGFPIWSNGTEGTHYPAIAGMVMILAGIAVLHMTLSKKARVWVWGIAIFLILAINFSCAYV